MMVHVTGTKKSKWVDVTKGYLLVYFWIICILGGIKQHTANLMWDTLYYTNISYVQNTCVMGSFKQIHCYIHFVDNAKLLPKTHPKWHPL